MDDPLTEERQCPYLLNLWNMGGGGLNHLR